MIRAAQGHIRIVQVQGGADFKRDLNGHSTSGKEAQLPKYARRRG